MRDAGVTFSIELGLPPLLRRRWGIGGVGVHERP